MRGAVTRLVLASGSRLTHSESWRLTQYLTRIPMCIFMVVINSDLHSITHYGRMTGPRLPIPYLLATPKPCRLAGIWTLHIQPVASWTTYFIVH